MKLVDLLSEATNEELERIAHEHARAQEQRSRPHLLDTIEGVVRSYRFLQEFLYNRQPPAFAIITLLLEEPAYSRPATGFREVVASETERICRSIESGEILKRDDQLRVYRRVLYQARSNDHRIDEREWDILGVLRDELNVSQAEHFLIEHHPDLREFWQQEGAFVRELHALRSAGIVFVRDGLTMLPEDLVGVIRQVLGIDMSTQSAKRLYLRLNGQELYDALARMSAPTSGSKEERVARLVTHMAQPRTVLRFLALEALRRICRDFDVAVSGSKDELVTRIVDHVTSGRDIAPQPIPPAPVKEERRLNQMQFERLFSCLRGHELASVLGAFDQPRWGSKSRQIQALWETPYSEATLLGCLSGHELETLLDRVELRPGGTKAERIARLLEHGMASSLVECNQEPEGTTGHRSPSESSPAEEFR